jgi:hypothetical protein
MSWEEFSAPSPQHSHVNGEGGARARARARALNFSYLIFEWSFVVRNFVGVRRVRRTF